MLLRGASWLAAGTGRPPPQTTAHKEEELGKLHTCPRGFCEWNRSGHKPGTQSTASRARTFQPATPANRPPLHDKPVPSSSGCWAPVGLGPEGCLEELAGLFLPTPPWPVRTGWVTPGTLSSLPLTPNGSYATTLFSGSSVMAQ